MVAVVENMVIMDHRLVHQVVVDILPEVVEGIAEEDRVTDEEVEVTIVDQDMETREVDTETQEVDMENQKVDIEVDMENQEVVTVEEDHTDLHQRVQDQMMIIVIKLKETMIIQYLLVIYRSIVHQRMSKQFLKVNWILLGLI